jgi:hypothetical protein
LTCFIPDFSLAKDKEVGHRQKNAYPGRKNIRYPQGYSDFPLCGSLVWALRYIEDVGGWKDVMRDYLNSLPKR